LPPPLWYSLPGLKRKFLIALVVVIFLIACLLLQKDRAYQRATYQGKHARAWAELLYPNFNPSGTNEAVMAFRSMGSNAVPVLCSMLRAREPFYEKPFLKHARQIPPAVRRYLFEQIKPGRTTSRRIGAARALSILGPTAVAAVPELMVALTDNSEVRWAAAQALARIGGPAIAAMAQATTSTNAAVRHAAVYGLGEAGTNAVAATSALFDRVLDPNESVRASALYSLSRVGSGGLPVVLAGFSDNDAARREAAVKALKAMNNPPRQVLRTLLEFSTNSAPDLRQHAIEALACLHLNHPLGVTVYWAGLRDTNAGVRAAAALALGQADAWTTNRTLGDVTVRLLGLSGTLNSNVVAVLTSMLDDPEAAVRSAAQQALTNLHLSKPD
jgi:HEAT repeat protein